MASQQSGLDGLSLPVAVLIGSVIISASILYASSRMPLQTLQVRQAVQAGQAQQGNSAPSVAVDIKNIKAAGEPTIGSATAPIEIAYWYDYQCPVCKSNESQIMPQVVKDYVDSGKIRIVFKDLQFLGPDSTSLGLVSRAVWQLAPAKFYQWHKAVFDGQGRENSGWATKDKILSITASVLGQDLAAKAVALADSNSASFKKDMDSDKQEGAAIGVRATPSFVIGKQLIVGLRDYPSVKAAIDASLK